MTIPIKLVKAVGEAYSQMVKEHGEDAALVAFAAFGMSVLTHMASAHRELLPLLAANMEKKEKKSCPPEPSA